MSDEYRAKLRSLHFSRSSRRGPKVTTDVHDSHQVTVTEHWHDRQDVKVHGLEPVHISRKDLAP